jgi:hypothetical protein
LAVSLDIVNAFNSLPWDRIGKAISHFGFPEYLRDVVCNYFRERSLSCTPTKRRYARDTVSTAMSRRGRS